MRSTAILRIDDIFYLLVGTISQVCHDDSEAHCLVRFGKKLLSVIWDKGKVVERIQAVNTCRIWQCIVTIIDKPSCTIVVEISRNVIEEFLIICK
jgi:hypothetical protein